MNEPIRGKGRLFSDPDPDRARAFFRKKSRTQTSKLTTVSEAVRRLVADGDYFASGGFGTNRIATAVLHEMLRQGKQDLSIAGHTTTHDFQIMAAGNLMGRGRLMARVDAAYIVGLEARGLSPHARRIMESGEVEVCEGSNYALALRFQAAAMGVPFLPTRVMAGTDTFRYSAAAEVVCPFTGKTLIACPALYPDVAAIHVHEADLYGNARIHGITVADLELARAAKKVVLTAERIVPHETFREDPARTSIPFYCVDAVCEVPFGSYPGNMSYEYFSDEAHLTQWLEAEKDLEAFRTFLDQYIYKTQDFQEYLAICGGLERMRILRGREYLLPTEEKGS